MITFKLHCWFCILLTNFTLAHEYNPSGWKAASEWIKRAVNESADPCEDFLEFACGNWQESYADSNKTSENDRVSAEIASILTTALQKINLKNPKTEEYKKSVKIFYDQCNNRPSFSRPDPDNFETFRPLLENIYTNLAEYLLPHVRSSGTDDEERYLWENGTDSDFWKFVGTMKRVLRIPFLIEAEVLPAVLDCKSVPALHLRPAPMPLYSELSTDDMLDILLTTIAKYHNKSFHENDVNDTKTTLSKISDDFWQLYFSKSEHFMYNLVKSDPKHIRVLKYDELRQQYPSINWDAFFQGLLPEDIREIYMNSNPTILLEFGEHFEKISPLIEKHGYLTATNFGFTIALMKFAKFFISGEMITVDRRGLGDTIFEDNICLDLVVRYFSPASLRLLCDEYKVDIENSRNDILMMKDLVFSAFRFLVYSMDWLSPTEKMIFIDKANVVKFYGDIPWWINNDTILNSKTPKYDINRSLVANDIFAQKELFRSEMMPLVSGSMDDAPPIIQANAWNDIRGDGSIRYLVGIQLPPYYSYTYPLAVKFGLSGMVIGHELMHSFATFLYQDPSESPYSWLFGGDRLELENSTFSLLRSKVECLIPFYNEYCKTESELFVDNKPDDSCSIGNFTIEENTADNEGLKIAYAAYKFATQTLGSEPLLTDLTQFTAEQLFFLAYARRSCSTGTKLQFDEGDPHASIKARVEQPLMNFPPFAKAFGCKSGQRYSRKTHCSVYGNVLS